MRMHVIVSMNMCVTQDEPQAAEAWVATSLDSEIKDLFNAIIEDRIAIEYVDSGFNFTTKETIE